MTKKTNKTAHVLKLLTNSDESIKENPILNEEFKDEMIHSRSASEKKNDPDVPKAIEMNIIAELVQENLPAVLERFRCCSCQICRAEITVAALNQISPQYAYATNGSYNEVNKLKDKYRAGVVSTLVKLAIQLKNNPIHK